MFYVILAAALALIICGIAVYKSSTRLLICVPILTIALACWNVGALCFRYGSRAVSDAMDHAARDPSAAKAESGTLLMWIGTHLVLVALIVIIALASYAAISYRRGIDKKLVDGKGRPRSPNCSEED